MVNNQIEFNNEYNNKEVLEITLECEEEFEGELVIENYSKLESLFLRDNESIEKVVFRNLEKLKRCEVWKCDTKELMIENCPQIKILDIRNNYLTSLEFIKDLDNLETLEWDGNTELIKILESVPYKGDWKIFRKVIQGSNEDTRKLLEKSLILEEEKKSLNIKYAELKRFLKEKLFALLSPEEKGNLVNQLERKKSLSAPGMTKELMLNTEAIIDMEKEIKKELEDELIEAKTKIQKLEQELKKLQTEDPQYQQLKENIEKKKIELAELKNVIIKNNKLEEDDLEDILEDQTNFLKTGDSKRLERTKKKLAKIISEEEINELCQLQGTIVELEIELGETQVSQINQIVNNNSYYYSLGPVSAQGGNVLIGNNTFTGTADFRVQNFETAIEQKTTKPFWKK